ncbi:MAG: 2,5-diamino-6-(ribosylamino)-4(3H)-pyrimidinone 5'-phosphate reductase [Candidatus Lokiarchaeota archaeon]|nr:2,5-diamino-6-(ribosylamino)-4(3H)-pyrimidinone 5'-phosphate reductase [Candidatus Lokiarchaeota archaeon]
MRENKKPYIILSAAMTIDGRIASKTGDPELSDEEDWKEVHKLRTEVDAIMVGKGTILIDNPKLHIKYYDHNGYYRIVLDSNLSIPIHSKVLNYQTELYPTLICATNHAPKERVRTFESKENIEVINCGESEKVDLMKLMPILKQKGIKKILLEGGGTLNWSFIKHNLIDELRLTIAPWLVGGKGAISLVEGVGFSKMDEAPRFNLVNIKHRNNYVTLQYKAMR